MESCFHESGIFRLIKYNKVRGQNSKIEDENSGSLRDHVLSIFVRLGLLSSQSNEK